MRFPLGRKGYNGRVERGHTGKGMDGQSPWQKLRELGVRAPKEFALLPPIVLDRISTDWVLGPGNDLLTHYIATNQYYPREGLSQPDRCSFPVLLRSA